MIFVQQADFFHLLRPQHWALKVNTPVCKVVEATTKHVTCTRDSSGETTEKAFNVSSATGHVAVPNGLT